MRWILNRLAAVGSYRPGKRPFFDSHQFPDVRLKGRPEYMDQVSTQRVPIMEVVDRKNVLFWLFQHQDLLARHRELNDIPLVLVLLVVLVIL